MVTGRPDRSVAVALGGAALIAWSAPLVRLADVPPATAAVGRCALAVPALWLLARWERRRAGALPERTKRYADLASDMTGALQRFAKEVAEGTYPAPEHTYS